MKPLTPETIELFISINNRFVEAFEGRTTVERVTGQPSDDLLLTNYKFFIYTVLERTISESGVDKQKAALADCGEALFSSARKCYLAGLSHLTKACEDLFDRYKAAKERTRRKAGLAEAPKVTDLDARIRALPGLVTEIKDAVALGLKGDWKTLFESWNRHLDTANTIIRDMDKFLEKMDKMREETLKLRLQIGAFVVALIGLVAGGGLVKYWGAISSMIGGLLGP